MKIGITGCKGRMGALLTQELLSGVHKGAALAGGTVLSDELKQYKDSAFFITDDADELFKKSDAVIDFTSPGATQRHTVLAAKHGKTYVVGTTGLRSADEENLKEAAKKTRVVHAANMSVGLNVLLTLVEQASTALTENWDIEIFESHHKHKVDAPSGTALALGKAAAAGRGGKLEKMATYERYGETGARKDGNIGFSVARGGDVVGDHTVYFYGQGERIEITHRATDRSLFAKGAIRAAIWAHKQKKNGLYSMQDVLGI